MKQHDLKFIDGVGLVALREISKGEKITLSLHDLYLWNESIEGDYYTAIENIKE